MINNSGIGVYIREYIIALLEDDFIALTIIGRYTDLEPIYNQFSIERRCNHIEADIPIYSVKEQIILPKLIPSCDVFWSPHYNIPILPIRAKKRLVTIPDVFHLAHLKLLSIAQKAYAKIVTNTAVLWSNKILTISNFSKKEIIRLTNVDANKIETIHLGINLNHFTHIKDVIRREEVRVMYNLPERFVLFVGNVKPNKNLRLLVEAFSQLTGKMDSVKLLIAGKKDGFITGDPTLFERIQKDIFLRERVLFSGFVEDEHLPVMYSMANVFAFPSLYEGFGFPPLEAMACRCPVVASDAGSIPEICGDAPIYIDPHNPTDLANGIKKIILNQNFREKLIEDGLKQVEQYNWQESKRKFVQEVKKLSNK